MGGFQGRSRGCHPSAPPLKGWVLTERKLTGANPAWEVFMAQPPSTGTSPKNTQPPSWGRHTPALHHRWGIQSDNMGFPGSRGTSRLVFLPPNTMIQDRRRAVEKRRDGDPPNLPQPVLQTSASLTAHVSDAKATLISQNRRMCFAALKNRLHAKPSGKW